MLPSGSWRKGITTYLHHTADACDKKAAAEKLYEHPRIPGKLGRP